MSEEDYSATSREKILFVDDERNFLEAIRRLLRPYSSKWEVFFADSAEEALHIVETTNFDAIVSDMSMPRMNGLDFIKRLQLTAQNRHTPVIILTGREDTELKRQALDCGATDLLTKPIGLEDLRARLTSVLRLKHYQDQLKQHNDMLEVKVRERTQELELSRLDIVWRLAKAGEHRDTETGNHVIRVAIYSRYLAEMVGLPLEEVLAIFITSPLHDIGKIGIPDEILLKQGMLTAEERVRMERHCEIGAAILLDEPMSRVYWDEFFALTGRQPPSSRRQDPLRFTAATIALAHHERWDGSGYPQGLSREDIPIAGRIVAVADLYDALRSVRPYKEAYSLDETMHRLQLAKGSYIDPSIYMACFELVDTFEAVRDRYPT